MRKNINVSLFLEEYVSIYVYFLKSLKKRIGITEKTLWQYLDKNNSRKPHPSNNSRFEYFLFAQSLYP